MPEVTFGDGVTVTLALPSVAFTMEPPATSLAVVPVAGPPGPPGLAGGDPVIWDQSTPAATWTIPHSLGRIPASVEVVLADGEVVDTDTNVDDTQVVLTFAAPIAGTALIL